MMLIEMHQDVLDTPGDLLIPALDYVKHTVLQGEPYRAESCPRVALGLRTYLASSADEKRRELEEQTARSEARARRTREEAASERRLRIEAEDQLRQQVLNYASLVEENDRLVEQVCEEGSSNRKLSILLSTLGATFGIVWWNYVRSQWISY